MSMRTAWRPEPKEPLVVKTPQEVLDKPQRRWPVPLMVLAAVLLGMGSGAWIAGNNERALDATAERLVEVSEQLESARIDLATARDDLASTRAALDQLQAVERVADRARSDNAAAREDLDQVVFAAAEMFDALPPEAVARLKPVPRDLAVLERSFAAVEARDAAGFRDTFARNGRMTLVFAGLSMERRGDGIRSLIFPRGVRLVGQPAQTDEFLWSRYRETETSGVVVSRLQGGRILRQWHVALRW